MLSMPLKWVVGTALMVAMTTTGLIYVAGQSGEDPSVQTPEEPRKPVLGTRPVEKANPHRQFNQVPMPDYIVEPPDIIVVEVLEPLFQKPITGERLVRPDGKISLGDYGEVFVAGLTTTEIKEKIINHLRQYLTPEGLGLRKVVGQETIEIDPRKSDRVFVDVVSFNSKVYYVQGEVESPGRLPITGNEKVIDAITYGGGPTFKSPGAAMVKLVRPAPRGQCCEQSFTVDLAALISKSDMTTNYQLMPGDRLVVYRDPKLIEIEKRAAQLGSSMVADHEARLREIERKLDLILKKLDISDKP